MCAGQNLPALLNNIAEKEFSYPQAHAAGRFWNTCRYFHPSCPTSILGDGDRLSQVFSNLVDNALKHTTCGGAVTLQTRLSDPATSHESDSQIQVDVADTRFRHSARSPAAYLERFYQAESIPAGRRETWNPVWVWPSSKKLLLRTVVKLAFVSIPGSGSLFTVTLPLTPPAALPSPAEKNKISCLPSLSYSLL